MKKAQVTLARDVRSRFTGRAPMDLALAEETADLSRRFAEDLDLAGMSPRTTQSYVLSIRDLAEFHGRSPEVLQQCEIRAWVRHLRGRGLSASRLRQHFAALKFLFCRTLGCPAAVSFVAWPTAEQPAARVFTIAEVQRLLEHVRAPRMRVLFILIYATGLRLGEACRLEVSDVEASRGLIAVRASKFGASRIVPLAPALLELLRMYWRVVRPHRPLLFVGRGGRGLHPGVARVALRRAGEAAGLAARVTPHSLRHAFATHLLESGTSVRVIQVAMGHRSIRTTAAYMRVSDRTIARMLSPITWLTGF